MQDIVARQLVLALADAVYALGENLRDMHYGEISSGINQLALSNVEEILNDITEIRVGRVNGGTVL